MTQKIRKEWREFCLLLEAVPTTLIVLFIMSVFAMNLLANKSLSIPWTWLALDAGFLVSWFAFLSMDIIATYFGPKGATQISIFAMLFNLAFCLLLFVGSRVPGSWGEAYVPGSEQVINNALDATFGGSWYVVLGSSLAFMISALINNFLNYSVGKLFKDPTSFGAYIVRTHISTSIGQFADNLTFALVVSHVFFGWSLLQCVMCAFTGMIAETIAESLFSVVGFRYCEKLRKNEVGSDYLKMIGA